MKRLILLSLVILQSVLLAACNTVAGAGEDISHAGHAISSEANEHR